MLNKTLSEAASQLGTDHSLLDDFPSQLDSDFPTRSDIDRVVDAPNSQVVGFSGSEGTKFRNLCDSWAKMEEDEKKKGKENQAWLPTQLEYAFNRDAPGCFGKILKDGNRYWKYNRIPNVHRYTNKATPTCDRVLAVMEDLEKDNKTTTPKMLADLLNEETRCLYRLVDEEIEKRIVATANSYGMKYNKYFAVANIHQIGKN